MKFIHTADWQIGMNAAHAGAVAARVREERFSAAARLVEQARSLDAEFIAIAGDTFEHNAVDRVLVQRISDILAAFGRPVFIIPGNHDPFVPGSVWEHSSWNATRNVHILTEQAPVPLNSGELFPCPIYEPRSRRDPTSWIPDSRSDGIRIGLAHGTVEGVLLDEPEYPIPLDAASRKRLDYVALGHWHSETRFQGVDGAVRMGYSGTHEPCRFGERDSGYALLIEIAVPGAAPDITPIRTGGLRWDTIEREVTAPEQLRELRAEIESIADPGGRLLDLRLKGLLFAADHQELQRIQELIDARFLFGRMEYAALRPAPSDAVWIEALPEGVLRETATQLRLLAEGVGAPDGTSQAVATQALIELYNLSVEVQS
jgi:DNA repair exonuclease SbcCD nuclease subunit